MKTLPSIRIMILPLIFSLLGSGFVYGEDDTFSLIIIPDTQIYADKYPGYFYDQTEWIAEHYDSLYTKMVIHLGDITNNATPDEWNVAKTAMDDIYEKIPTALNVGNHDYDPNVSISRRQTLAFNQTFSSFAPPPTLVQVYKVNKLNNTAHSFHAMGTDYLVLNLEFGPTNDMVEWANQVITEYPNHKVIVVTHCYLNADNERVKNNDLYSPKWTKIGEGMDGEDIWHNLVRKHKNIFMVLCGHMLDDGVGKLVSTGDHGNKVAELLSNYQMQDHGGNGFLRIMTFHPQQQSIHIQTYSPSLDSSLTDSQNQFTLSSFTDAFSRINTAPEIASLSSLSFDEDDSLQLFYSNFESYITDEDPFQDLAVTVVDGQFVKTNRENTNGVLLKAPLNWFGTDTLTLQITDTQGLQSEADFVVAVLPINDPPKWQRIPEITILEDSSDRLDLSPYISDVDDPLNTLCFDLQTIDQETGSTHMISHFQVDSMTFSFYPIKNYNGRGQIRLIASDQSQVKDTTTTDYFIKPVNDPPVWQDLPDVTLSEDSVDSLQIFSYIHDVDHLVTDLDVSAQIIAFQAIQTGHQIQAQHDLKVQINPQTGITTFTTSRDSSGIFEVEFTARDPQEGFARDSITVTVQPQNDPPQILTIPALEIQEDQKVTLGQETLLQGITDPDDPLSALQVTLVKSPHIEIEAYQDAWELSPKENWFGTDSLHMKVTDPHGSQDSSNLIITVTAVNDPPRWEGLPDIIVNEDESDSLHLFSFVSDVDHTISKLAFSTQIIGFHQYVTDPHIAELQDLQIEVNPQTGIATFTTSRDSSGIFEVEFTACDPQEGVGRDSITVTVQPQNDPPTIRKLPTVVFNEDEAEHIRVSQWMDYVSDPETPFSQLSWSVENGTHVVAKVSEDQIYLAGPTNWFGLDTLQVNVMDHHGSESTAELWVNLLPVNDRPMFQFPMESMELFSDSLQSIDLWLLADDIETPDNNLIFHFKVPARVHYQFFSEYGHMNLQPKQPGEKIEGWLVVEVQDSEAAVARDSLFLFTIPTRVPDRSKEISDFRVSLPYPNPFNNRVRIKVNLPRKEHVTIDIYNFTGQRVTQLHNGPLGSGVHSFTWNATKQSSGIFFFKIKTTSMQLLKKCILLQ